jgi:uncharacterized protein yjdA
MVLAVVGTMKAGKSTTINAIVGREILPNRNRPMTALPTLIEHKPGQKTPVLRFAKNQPIQDLIERLKEAAHSFQSEELQAKLDGDRHLQDALENLRKTRTMAETYEGEEGIFHFLAWLNDLVRLSAALEVPFPFEAYTGVGDFPRIEVEFFHLRNQAEMGQGKFTILDTPGFNEADQSQHLLPMMREQLEKASAVLAVLDYTQLKSESEKDLRDQLNAIANQSKGRMFALVNKFDAKTSNSDNAEQTREYVAKKLLAAAGIPAENIFPVSSLHAYLAQRAQLALTEGGIQWQPGQPASWIDDFGKEAIDKRKWQQRITEATEVQEAADDLWTESKFDEPLENVIRFGHRRAALLAVAAAASVLSRNAKDLKQSIKGRLQSQQAAPEELRSLIKKTKEQISQIYSMRNDIENQLKNDLEDAKQKIEDAMSAAKKKAEGEIDSLMEKRRIKPVEYFSKEIRSIVEEQKWYKDNHEKTNERAIDDWVERLPKSFEECCFFMEELREAHIFDSMAAMEEFFDTDKTGLFKREFGWGKEKRAQQARENIKKRMSGITIKEGAVFKSETEAESMLEEIHKTFNRMLSGINEEIQKKTTDTGKTLEDRLSGVRKKMETEIKEFSEHAQSIGLESLTFDAPASIRVKKMESVLNINHMDFIDQENKKRSFYEKQDGTFGGAKRLLGGFFGTRWGYDKRQKDEPFFRLDITKVKDYWSDKIETALQELRNQVEEEFVQPLENSHNDYFSKVQCCFEQVQQIMQKGLADQSYQEQILMDIRHELENLQQQFGTSDEDAETLDKWASRQSENHAAASLQ